MSNHEYLFALERNPVVVPTVNPRSYVVGSGWAEIENLLQTDSDRTDYTMMAVIRSQRDLGRKR